MNRAGVIGSSLNLISTHLFEGRLAAASSLVDELATVSQATGSNLTAYAAMTLAAFRGREAEAAQLIETATREGMSRREGEGLTFIQWATAVLRNGLGGYAEALAAAHQSSEDALEIRLTAWGLVELIEAAARSGKPERAVEALGRLSQSTAASGTDWAIGIEARSAALLSGRDEAGHRGDSRAARVARGLRDWSAGPAERVRQSLRWPGAPTTSFRCSATKLPLIRTRRRSRSRTPKPGAARVIVNPLTRAEMKIGIVAW